uniref:Uncharacterized protein n=1 Tax=Arundo donax TaxID=35708 RepID=A0A0A9B9K9_ARUDO
MVSICCLLLVPQFPTYFLRCVVSIC